MKPTFLIGFMGSGKSTIAKLLADDFVDLDTVIVDKIGMSISEFFEQFGEAKFRELETETLKSLSTTHQIISTGGGIVMSEENRQFLKDADVNVVYLEGDFDKLYARILADKENIRPIAISRTREELFEIYQHRADLYDAVATHKICVTDKTPEEIAKEIQL